MASQEGITPVDMGSLNCKVREVEQRSEDPDVAIRYLENIIAHPDDPKYRRLKKSNRKFEREVWLQPSVREVFLAIGFEQRQEEGVSMVVLEPFPQERQKPLAFVLKKMLGIRQRRRRGYQGSGGAGEAAAAGGQARTTAAGAGYPSGARSHESQARGNGGFRCQSCGRTSLMEDIASNRPDVLWRSRRRDHAVTCRACGPGVFVICGECFNTQAHDHPPDHLLILYANPERLAEQNPWPSRNRPPAPPPESGRGGRPRRGPWG